MLHSRGTRALALALTASAVAAPAAIAQPIDGVPSVPDAATQRLLAQERYYEQHPQRVDAHHAALIARHDTQRVDLRTPDARDAAQGRYLGSPGAQPSTVPPATRIVHVTDAGLDWGDAAIGAGTAFGLSLIAVGAVGVGRRLRPQSS